MKETLKKLSNVCKWIFGYGIMIALFLGGLTFFGYLIALFVGGETAVEICSVIKTVINPIMTYISTIMVLFGLLTMYLAGEIALAPSKRMKKGIKNMNYGKDK